MSNLLDKIIRNKKNKIPTVYYYHVFTTHLFWCMQYIRNSLTIIHSPKLCSKKHALPE